MEMTVGIALVGCGTVGGATALLLQEQRDSIRFRTGVDLDLRYIVDKNLTYARKLGLSESILTESLEKALSDSKVSVVIELVGGTGFAKTLILQAFAAGKHVVTANKALLAYHGPELFAAAKKAEVALAFEASCGGGIPIVRAFYDGLTANTIDAVYGIVNGTCNHILSEMIQKDSTYDEALKGAQAAGFAEADPSLDVNGGDSAHKIAIMGAMAFGSPIPLDTIPVKGIANLEAEDVLFGGEMGYVVKLIASAVRGKKGVFVRVEPAFIPMDHPLAWVSGSFNAISVYGSAVGHTMYYGRGAGGTPTASAVVSDIISLGLGTYPVQFKSMDFWNPDKKPLKLQEPGDIHRRYYLKLRVLDRPGNLGRITTVLGENAISVSSILQHEIPEATDGEVLENTPPEAGVIEPTVPIVITTHRVKESQLLSAIEDIEALEDVYPGTTVLPILEEHPEFRYLNT